MIDADRPNGVFEYIRPFVANLNKYRSLFYIL
jgi:hypothetical protein